MSNSIDYIEWACPKCHAEHGDDDFIARDHTPFVNPIARLITAYGKPAFCACGEQAMEREVRMDGSVLELHPDGDLFEVVDGVSECVGHKVVSYWRT